MTYVNPEDMQFVTDKGTYIAHRHPHNWQVISGNGYIVGNIRDMLPIEHVRLYRELISEMIEAYENGMDVSSKDIRRKLYDLVGMDIIIENTEYDD